MDSWADPPATSRLKMRAITRLGRSAKDPAPSPSSASSSSTPPSEMTNVARKLSRRVASERRNEPSPSSSPASSTASSSSSSSSSSFTSSSSSSSTTSTPQGLPATPASALPAQVAPGGKLNKASSWVSRLAHTSAASDKRMSTGDMAPLSPRSPRDRLPTAASIFAAVASSPSTPAATTSSSCPTLPSVSSSSSPSSPPSASSAALSSSQGLSASSPPAGSSPMSSSGGMALSASPTDSWEWSLSGGEGGDPDEEERRKKRFFNNLVFFKDVENVKPGSDGHAGDGLAAAAMGISSAPSSPAITRRGTEGSAKRTGAALGRSASNQKGSLEEGDHRDGSASGGGITPRADRLRKVTSGRHMDSFLRNARLTTNAAGLSAHPTSVAKIGPKKKRSDIIEQLVSAEKAYMIKINMIITVRWFFGRVMLAIHDEVNMRPGLEKVLGQFDSYLKQHADFLSALNEKLRQSWDNATSLIGDLLIDKMGFLQCYWDYCSENQQQWQQVEDSKRASFCFGLFVGHMDRKIQFTLQFQDENALKSLFNAPLLHLPQYVALLKELMEVTSIHHPDYAATRKAYFQAKVIVGSMQPESFGHP